MQSKLRETKKKSVSVNEPARRSKEAVVAATLAATYELLSETGLGGVSVDEVSRRSGVAKTTIYRYWARLHAGRWSSVIPSVIDAAERDPEIAELHSRLHAGMMTAFRTVVARARERGEIGAERDPAEITGSIAGPLFYRRWFSREPLDEEFVRGLVKRAIGPQASLRPRPRGPSKR